MLWESATPGLEGPAKVQALEHGTWTLVYTVGRAGIRPGGGIRVALRHLAQWSAPQSQSSSKAGYVTVHTQGDAPANVVIDQRRRYFLEQFPWQNVTEVTWPGHTLTVGQTVRVTFGDRSGGGPGIRVQPFDERRFVFKVYVDARGTGEYLPLAESPAIEVLPADPYRLALVMPSDAVPGQATWCLVRAEDRYGNPAISYRGRVCLRANDARTLLPAPYTFTAADRGVHRFESVVFGSVASHQLSVSDGPLRATSNPVRVAAIRPKTLLLWGDLHGHTLFSDGRGTVEEYYDFAERVAGLDFCAVTDHAFEVTADMWKHSKQVTNDCYRPGEFVTFQAFEWSGTTDVGGDHNAYFLEDDPPIYRSLSYYDPRNLQMYHGAEPKVGHVKGLFAELAKRLKDRDVFCIPHYGGRRGNPAWHDARVQRMVEVFSEHRRSEDWANTFLTKGYRMGVMASSDGHYGNPGYGYLKPTYDWPRQEIGMAAVAVYAAERTRESVFRSLYERRVYATSGDRIILDVRADGHCMGSEYATAVAPTIAVEATGTAPIARIEIKKDSKVVYACEPREITAKLQWRDADFQAQKSCYYYVRLLQIDNEEAISSPIWVN